MKTWADLNIDIGHNVSGEIKAICPWCAHTRKKKNLKVLNVNLDQGLYHCWHCGVAGTLKGGEWQKPEIRKVYSKPAFVPPAQVPDGTVAWFKTRGIDAAALERNRITKGIAYFSQVEEERDCIMFPYYRDGEVINIKYRSKDKMFCMASGAERVLYGLDDINPDGLIWVEGEIDKLSLEMCNLTSCVSVPDGAPAANSKSYSTKFEFLSEPALAEVKAHIIAVDNDEPGVRLQEELIRRLGRDKCLVVVWPDGCKDANEVLIAYGPDILLDCIKNARPLPVEGTYTASDFKQSMRDRYRHGAPRGISTGWQSVDHHYRVMTGEWTLVTGIPGAGKSEWLDALAINLAREHGWSFAVFSPENQPVEYHLEKLAEKYVGKPAERGPTERMTEAEQDKAMEWIDEHFTFLLPENPTVDGMLSTAQSLVTRRGIRGLIIDPWNEVDHMRPPALTETEYISQSLSKIRKFAREHGVHVWIVAHPSKLYKDRVTGVYPIPTPYDVSGSAHWRNKADNCITVHRDQPEHSAAVQIHVQKIRKKQNGRIGMVELRYNVVVGQYACEPNYMPKAIPRSSAQPFHEVETV